MSKQMQLYLMVGSLIGAVGFYMVNPFYSLLCCIVFLWMLFYR